MNLVAIHRRLRAIPAAVLCCGLAACGGFHPGAAVHVAGTEVSTARVDHLTDEYCVALAAVQQVSSRAAVRNYIGQSLATRATVIAFAESVGIDTTKTVEQVEASVAQSITSIPPEQAAAVAEVESSQSLLQALAPTIGAKLDPDGTKAEQNAAASAAFTDFTAKNKVTINPALGGLRLATAVSESAKVLSLDVNTLNPTQAAALPKAQQCGQAQAQQPETPYQPQS